MTRKKILVIEDDETIATLMAHLLELEGYSVAGHFDGNKVPEKLREVLPDLVLLDIMLPGDDGYNITRKMSEDPEFSKIPILILSALEESRPLFNKFPQVKGFLDKPVKDDVLLKAIADALQTPV